MEVYEMINYLEETYNGLDRNMLLDSVYYCYTLYDTQTGKYYSGSRGVRGRSTHDLLEDYFSSSSVVNFVRKLEDYPDLFRYRIEYFASRAEAFAAEKKFHHLHQVGKNRLFLNSVSSGGSNCGAGSLLCRAADGKIYRVSVEEYATGNHASVSTGMLNIRTDDGIKKIFKKDFDPEIHTTEFKDYVLALDQSTGKNRRVAKSEFENDTKYVGITKGMVVAYDTVDKVTVSVTLDEFKNSDGRYIGNTAGLVPVIDRETGTKHMIRTVDYDRDKFKHFNEGNVVVYSLSDRRNVKISKQEYADNISNYANQCTKCFYKVDGKFFKSKKDLNTYYRATRNICVLNTSQFDISSKFNDIETITREEHRNGKD